MVVEPDGMWAGVGSSVLGGGGSGPQPACRSAMVWCGAVRCLWVVCSGVLMACGDGEWAQLLGGARRTLVSRCVSECQPASPALACGRTWMSNEHGTIHGGAARDSRC
jgi:hypothetical protein